MKFPTTAAVVKSLMGKDTTVDFVDNKIKLCQDRNGERHTIYLEAHQYETLEYFVKKVRGDDTSSGG